MENQKEYIQSIENSYKYLIEKKTFEEIYLQNNPDDLYIFFGEVDKDIENDEIDTMISAMLLKLTEILSVSESTYR